MISVNRIRDRIRIACTVAANDCPTPELTDPTHALRLMHQA
jgi:hypothetical protein